MTTTVIYPEIEFRTTKLKNEVHVLASTWVPLKRDSKYYKVFYSDNIKVSDSEPKQHLEFFNFTNRVHNGALRLKYLWAAPDKNSPLINPEGIKRDIMELTDKERFLLNLKLL